MTLIKRLFLIICSFILVAPTGYAKNKKRIRHKAETANTFEVLSLEQVAALEYWNRVDYIIALRKSWIDVEKFQKVYGTKYMTSQNSSKKPDLWAAFFGDDANAASSSVTRQLSPYEQWVIAMRRAQALKKGQTLEPKYLKILQSPPVDVIQNTFPTDVPNMKRYQKAYSKPIPEPKAKVFKVISIPTAPIILSQTRGRIHDTPPIKKATKEAPPGSHNRGSSTGDRCIYAGNLQNYTSNRNSFGCSMPGRCKTENGDRGIRCGFTLSGLSGKNSCVATWRKLDSTEVCIDKGRRLQDLQSKESENRKKLLREFREYSSGKKSWPKDKGRLDKRWVNELKKYAYDPMVMAYLIKLSDDYKNKSLVFPIENFRRDYDEQLDGLQAVYGEYIAHCNKPLSNDTIHDIIDYKSVKSAGNRSLEKKRFNYYTEGKKKNSSDPNWRPTVGEVLQVSQCKLVMARYNNSQQALKQIEYKAFNKPTPPPNPNRGTRVEDPNLVAKKPPGIKGKSTGTIKPIPIAKPAPPKNRVPGYAPAIYRNACFKEDFEGVKTVSKAMKCVACAEQARVQSDPETFEVQKISDKWTSLLSIMAKRCGRGQGSSPLNVSMALEAMQTFGSCSNKHYDWSGKDLKHSATIKAWQNGDLENADSSSWGSTNPTFEKIYGASLKHLSKVFCGPKKNRRAKLINSVRNSSRKYSKELKTCISQANLRAEKYYSSTKKPNQCAQMLPFNIASTKQTLEDVFYGEPAILEMGSGRNYDCFVSTSTNSTHNQSDHKKTNEIALFSSMNPNDYHVLQMERKNGQSGKADFFALDERVKQNMKITSTSHSKKSLCANSTGSSQKSKNNSSTGSGNSFLEEFVGDR